MTNTKGLIISKYVIYIFLTFFTILVYVVGLFPETTVDSAKYASVSREILESGDFVHLKIHGEPYLQKPPLLFWLGAVSFGIFGINIVAFKIPTLLFTCLGIYSTYRLGKLIYDERTGILAAVIIGSSEALFLYNMDVHTDMLLTSNIIFSVWQIAEYLAKKRVLNYILGFIGIGLAMISKGMIGLAVPVFTIGGYLLLKWDIKRLFSLKWLAGLPIIIIILYPTLKGLYDQFGMEGLRFYFWSNNIDRIHDPASENRHDFFFFFHTLIYIFLPWSLYAYTAFIKDWRKWRADRFSILKSKNLYSYSAVIIFGIIISISGQQSPHYLLPIIPFISIITARCLYDISFTELYPRTYKLMRVMGISVVILLWPVVFIMITYFFPTGDLYHWLPVVLMLILMIYSFIMLKSKIQKLVIPLLITILTVSYISNTNYMPSALEYHGPIQASYRYNTLAPDNALLYTYDYKHFETYFYPKNASKKAYASQLPDILSEGTCWFITTEKGYSDIQAYDEQIITQRITFQYKKLTNISIKFLNPKTRQEELQNIYLLRIR